MKPVMLDKVIIDNLKASPIGKKARRFLRERMKIQLEDLKLDPMTARIEQVLQVYSNRLQGNILDVGCYTGFLYHYLGKPNGYTGIDIWPDAIDVAREFAPEADFRVADALKFSGWFDSLWCSQIIWGENTKEAVEKICRLAKCSVFVLTNQDANRITGRIEKLGSMNVLIHD